VATAAKPADKHNESVSFFIVQPPGQYVGIIDERRFTWPFGPVPQTLPAPPASVDEDNGRISLRVKGSLVNGHGLDQRVYAGAFGQIERADRKPRDGGGESPPAIESDLQNG
jgi:hypothetical protein